MGSKTGGVQRGVIAGLAAAFLLTAAAPPASAAIAGLKPSEAPLITASQASSLKQECAASILKMPKRGHLLLFINPGTWRQYIYAFFRFEAVNDKCDAWRRISQIRPQIRKSGRWLDALPREWTTTRWFPLPLGRKSNDAVEPGLGLIANPPRQSKPPQLKHVFVCRTHGNWDRVRLIMRNLMRNRSTGKIAAEKYKYWRVPVDPKHYKPCDKTE